jgi:hypothetical protein
MAASSRTAGIAIAWRRRRIDAAAIQVGHAHARRPFPRHQTGRGPCAARTGPLNHLGAIRAFVAPDAQQINGVTVDSPGDRAIASVRQQDAGQIVGCILSTSRFMIGSNVVR